MKKREQGILTVEASIVLTLCILFILFLFSFARVYSAQSLVSHAVLQSSDAVALESYLREATLTGSEADVTELANRFMGTTSISADSYTSLRSADVPKIAKEKFVYALGNNESAADQKLKKLGVKDGLAGMDFSASKIDLGNDDVIVYVNYTIQMQFPVFGMDEISVTKAAKSKTFGDVLFGISVVPENPIMGAASGSGSYKYGSQVQISATPNYGYKFKKWADGNTDNPRTVTVTGAQTYVAVFEESEFGVNLVSSPGAGGSTSGGGTYKYLDSATISATPATGYHFTKWSIYSHKDKTTKSVNNQTTSLNIDQTYTCTANFDKNSYTVKVETSGTTSANAYIVYNSSIKSSITALYQSGFKLTAPSVSGYNFLGWKVKGSDSYFSTALSVSMTVPATDLTYVAVYQVKPSIKITGGATEVHSAKLTAEVVPSDANVKWKSSNNSVVSVDETGLITAEGKGSAKITAYFVYNGVTYEDSKTITTDESIELVNYCRRDQSYYRHFYKTYPGANYRDKRWDDNGDGVWENRMKATWSEVSNSMTIANGQYLSAQYIKNHTAHSGQWAGVYNPQAGYNNGGEKGYVMRFTNGYDMIFFIAKGHAPKSGGGYYDYYISNIK